MRRLILLPFLILLFFHPPANAQQSGFGIGIILGEPTGISVKNFISNSVAIDGAVAWSFAGRSSLHLHADMLYHSFDQWHIDSSHLTLYYGPGARLDVGSHHWLGARFPVGVSYTMDDHIFEAFLELVPTFDIFPRTDFNIYPGLGVRFYF